MLSKLLSVLFLAATAAAACEKPQVQASSYTPADSQVLNAIPFITEFTLACGNGEKPVLYADIEGELVPVVQSADGAKYQVSWIRDIKVAKTGEHKVDLYDSDGYVAVRRARDRGDAATTAPLVSIIVSYPGSYGGPWLNSEHIAAGLAALVFYLAFSSKSSLLA